VGRVRLAFHLRKPAPPFATPTLARPAKGAELRCVP
jgi:hypothetical protein